MTMKDLRLIPTQPLQAHLAAGNPYGGDEEREQQLQSQARTAQTLRFSAVEHGLYLTRPCPITDRRDKY